ncbi:hypothetical protein K458DRAFT_405383 [Lentithecium fluviatile CBS 122367]|uniref:Uncharacterized protein n=1 Tax=Lentithecium fluviatile CBS 122367 TaxID=1168545 RepID=A0A6G1IWI2_9PLEO|nr:hypothetical protein K458DRAFT_405383 [Lentithecium fluviatile CBS 122367]
MPPPKPLTTASTCAFHFLCFQTSSRRRGEWAMLLFSSAPPPLATSQANKSSSSLEGMERPIRSFKSSIKTVPPHPQTTQKPLPPTPPLKSETPSKKKKSTPSPPASNASSASPARSSSVTFWKAPADWYESLLAPPILLNRSLAPLLPEPSPTPADMDLTSWFDNNPPPSAPLPAIYERRKGNADLGPPGSPPKSPLPAPSKNNGKLDEKTAPPKRDSGQFSPSALKTFFDSDLRHHTFSPTNSARTSITSNASTKEKAFASLGIGSPQQQSVTFEQRPYDPESALPIERTRADRQYLRGKKLQALNKGNTLVDDSWEGTEMDDKMRQLSFSQDYHDLLADQYQEMNFQTEEVLRTRGAHQVYEAQFEERRPKPPPKDQELIPRPLSWQKGSKSSTARIPSRNPSGNFSRNESPVAVTPEHSLQEKVQKWINSWVPRRLSVDPRRQSGLAVIRHSPSPAPRSGTGSMQPPSPTLDHAPSSSQPGSNSADSPVSNAEDHRSSLNSRHSDSPVAPGIAIRTAYRTSTASTSSCSRHSATSRDSHPLSQELHVLYTPRTPPAPPPPPPLKSRSPPLSPKAWNRLRSRDADDEHDRSQHQHHQFSAGFINKAKQARRKHSKDQRQKRLKRSIRVLGPTDPGVVAGYVRVKGGGR